MQKLALALVFTAGLLNATDFSSMTTEDLLNLKGSVPVEERDAFRTEMQSRISNMSADEKAALGVGQSRSSYGSANGTAQRLRDGSGSGGMYRGSRGRGGGRR
ncbi:DUF1104 domain-containing protein [Hydrogenimonas thermophila]|uniref:Uncharacterized protein n=1 Tax=Hydrogenimonas thermophila TaxID=223786 RepID=A0A1I5LX22_9BACT|nr:DUF1104 domain-containing protein [Hydrogenimonas thermophila]WOE70479.1 DUF1104 domain-containing protein [Hydrogenimonas thermophila]WOE72996.1 DUF1104 domain-containing protein [Hydrogenimonas thermophila]SFP01723.1 Protein of unknown function [Hydrogenimonas thermophila]